MGTFHRTRGVLAALSIISIHFLAVLPAHSQAANPVLKRQFKLFGGIGFPVGDFGESSTPEGGLAQTGITLGAELSTEVAPHFELGAGGGFNLHGADLSYFQTQFPSVRLEAGSWKIFWFTGLVGFYAGLSDDVGIYGHGNIGLLFANSPDFTAYSGGSSGHASSVSGTSLGYGFNVGLTFGEHFDTGLRYLAGEPSFTVNGVTGKQSIGVFGVTFGYIFQ
jgi:hypothetical protein